MVAVPNSQLVFAETLVFHIFNCSFNKIKLSWFGWVITRPLCVQVTSIMPVVGQWGIKDEEEGRVSVCGAGGVKGQQLLWGQGIACGKGNGDGGQFGRSKICAPSSVQAWRGRFLMLLST